MLTHSPTPLLQLMQTHMHAYRHANTGLPFSRKLVICILKRQLLVELSY